MQSHLAALGAVGRMPGALETVCGAVGIVVGPLGSVSGALRTPGTGPARLYTHCKIHHWLMERGKK